jgi:phenylalanyl-tRNA synthetase beta chain
MASEAGPAGHVPTLSAPALSERMCASIGVAGCRIGIAGVFRASVAAAYELPAGAITAELEFDPLAASARLSAGVVPPPRYPSVRRDIAVVVAERVSTADLKAAIAEAGAPLLESAVVFDVYRGKQIPQDAKSLAIRLVFRSPERTLTEAEAGEVFVRIVSALEKSFQARLRA